MKCTEVSVRVVRKSGLMPLGSGRGISPLKCQTILEVFLEMPFFVHFSRISVARCAVLVTFHVHFCPFNY